MMLPFSKRKKAKKQEREKFVAECVRSAIFSYLGAPGWYSMPPRLDLLCQRTAEEIVKKLKG